MAGVTRSGSGPEKVRIEGVSKVFPLEGGGRIVALEEVTFAVQEGEFLCVLGPSGCGKTTLLRLLAGLDAPTAGRVRVRAQDAGRGPGWGWEWEWEPPRPGERSAVVFQEHRLFPWRTVLGNVVFGLEERGLPRREREARARELLKLVGLEGFEARYPKELSSGMRQRVGLARALALDPEVLLMDEPFASLDAQTKRRLQEELLRLWETTRKTVVFVTHDVEEAVYLADRVLVLTARPGRVRALVEVDLPRPRDRLSPAFAAVERELLELVSSGRPAPRGSLVPQEEAR